MVSDYSLFDYSQHFSTHRIRQTISTPPQEDIRNFISVLICVVVVGLFFIFASLGIADTLPNKAKTGQNIHLKILASHPKIDKFYQEPFIYGGFTKAPICCISVPETNWKSLSASDKQALKDYASSLVEKVKSDPFKYARIPSGAPAASNVRHNVSTMSDNSWGIVVGKISPDGRDILVDKIITCEK